MIFSHLDARIELTELILLLNRTYLEYFGNANCALIMHLLNYEQYTDFKHEKRGDFSVGVTLDYISERTGLPRSTVHDQMQKMMNKDIFVKQGKNFKFRLDSRGIPLVQQILPQGREAIQEFLETKFMMVEEKKMRST